MGAGKTAIGRELARQLKLEFLDASGNLIKSFTSKKDETPSSDLPSPSIGADTVAGAGGVTHVCPAIHAR